MKAAATLGKAPAPHSFSGLMKTRGSGRRLLPGLFVWDCWFILASGFFGYTPVCPHFPGFLYRLPIYIGDRKWPVQIEPLLSCWAWDGKINAEALKTLWCVCTVRQAGTGWDHMDYSYIYKLCIYWCKTVLRMERILLCSSCPDVSVFWQRHLLYGFGETRPYLKEKAEQCELYASLNPFLQP